MLRTTVCEPHKLFPMWEMTPEQSVAREVVNGNIYAIRTVKLYTDRHMKVVKQIVDLLFANPRTVNLYCYKPKILLL